MNTVVPEEKLSRLRTLLSQWLTRRHASKHELQVLLGHLSHAAAVVRPGRMFLRQLIDTAKLPRLPAHKVRLNGGCRADISWWATFVQNWNGIAMFPQLPMGPKLISDASGSWGCGAYCPGEGTWFQLRWPQSWAVVNIAAKELLPIVAAAAIWGKAWNGMVIQVHSDNQAVVACLASRSARDPLLVHLLRCLFFFEAHFRFEHRAQHISGKLNTAADALSRDRLTEFSPSSRRRTSSHPYCQAAWSICCWTAPSVGRHLAGGSCSQLFTSGIALRTMTSYSSAQKRYLAFCETYNLQPLPLSESVSCLFAAFLAHQGLKSQSVSVYFVSSPPFTDIGRVTCPPASRVATASICSQGDCACPTFTIHSPSSHVVATRRCVASYTWATPSVDQCKTVVSEQFSGFQRVSSVSVLNCN